MEKAKWPSSGLSDFVERRRPHSRREWNPLLHIAINTKGSHERPSSQGLTPIHRDLARTKTATTVGSEDGSRLWPTIASCATHAAGPVPLDRNR